MFLVSAELSKEFPSGSSLPVGYSYVQTFFQETTNQVGVTQLVAV